MPLGDYSAQGDSYIGNHSFEYEGGAIYATGQLSVKQSRIENNSAGENGGAIVPTVSGTFTSDAFSGNSSEQNAGDIFDNSSVTILDSTFLKSTAEAEGGSIFESHGATLTMSGDMVQDGIANSPTDEQGGGGLDLNGVASLSDVTMTGNRVPSPDGYGGSILCINQCQLTLNGSLILGGAAYAGGAIAVTQSSTMLMDDTNLDGNDASVGGGILDDQSSDLQIDDSTVDANNALLRGGGIAVEQGGTLAMQNSTVARNRVPIFNGRGGGIEFSNSSGEQNDSLVNDTVSDNVAYIGAGIFANDVALGVQSSTITANSYGSNLDNGGGLFSDGKAVVSSTDSIWAGNEGLQCAGAPISDSGGFNLDSDNSCRLSSAGDLINRPALMGTLGSFGGPTPTVEPLSTSPAIGNGGTSCPTVDQRGVGVVKGQPCDIGSVFVQKSAISMAEGPTTLRKGDEETEKFVVLVVPEVASERPTGSVVVSSGVKTICVIELRPVVGSKKGDSTGACSPSASTLKTGTFHVFAVFNPSGFLARSTSLARKLKVVA
jgi:fibronectin-binding autotransporter adhesin